MKWSILALWALSLVIALGVGAWLGRGTVVSTHVGAPHSAPGAISIEADGWTHWIPADIAWTDTGGSLHLGGRPDCLPPDGTTQPVTFAAIDVPIEGARWRPVIWVSCR